MPDIRALMARALGMGSAKVDVDAECDYPLEITIQDHYRMYCRGGIGARVVTVHPEACWELDPHIYETEDPEEETPFEGAVKQLEKDHGLYALMEQADVDCGIGQYGVILLGFNDGQELSSPVEKISNSSTPRQLLYLRSFAQQHAKILEIEKDKRNPRYGQPTMYQIAVDAESGDASKSADQGLKVHWTRVVHICEKPGKEIYHAPRMENVFNFLLDLRKNYGGSAQMTWQGGFPGVAFEPANTDKDVQYELDPEAIKKSMDAYSRGLQRYLAVEGFIPKSLATQIYDPTPHIEVQLKAVALIRGVPYRIFLGTEEAQLAGSQDNKNWDRRVGKRQRRFCTPKIIRPLLDHLIMFGVLPEPGEDYFVEFPDRNETTREQKVKAGKDETEALARYVGGNVESVVPIAEYLTLFLGRTDAEVGQILEARDEQERLLADEDDLEDADDDDLVDLPTDDEEDDDES